MSIAPMDYDRNPEAFDDDDRYDWYEAWLDEQAMRDRGEPMLFDPCDGDWSDGDYGN